MDNNSNKQKVVNAIWENPEPAFNCKFRQSGRFWENADRHGEYNERGKIRLAQTPNGGNIMVFYNGGSRPEKTDVFTYLGDYVLNTTGFKETLTRLADIYNLSLEFNPAELYAMNREALAREVAPCLVEALRTNPDGVAAKYLTENRGLKVDGVHFGELSEQSIKHTVEYLKNKGVLYSNKDLQELGVTVERAAQGYNLAIPYYRNGIVKGIIYRDVTGTHPDRKYLYSEGLGRGGYCDNLTMGEPAVIVEGQLDAVRLIQAGIKNVVAMGGAKVSEDIAKLLKSRNITQVTYIPDLEYNEQGVKKTAIIADGIKAFQSVKVEDEPVITALYVAEIPAPEGVNLNGLKIDADTYGKQGGDFGSLLDFDAKPWWDWEITNLKEWAKEQDKTDGGVNINSFQNRFDEIYKRCVNPYEREAIKRAIKGDKILQAFAVTPEALADVDEWNRNRQYTDKVKAAATELQTAVENGANPVKIGEAVTKLAEAQGQNTREEWEHQLNQTFAEELDEIRNQPDTLRTKWELGNINKNGQFVRYGGIEFFPADIAVFCAATSHGKTAILFQSVFDLLRKYTDKTFIYVSCEENKRQLLERALNVYIDVETTANGKTSTGDYCFINQTRKKTIKAVLRGDVAPREYDEFMNVSKHYDAVAKQVNYWVGRYETEIRPRLKLIHTEGTAESITANILHYVSEFQNNGVEIGGVFVDYMQLLTSENKTYSRHDELKDVCKSLKQLAATTEIPVVIAAQLNRESIKTGIDDITVANIGEGADIERIAHDIYFVWQTDKTKQDLYFTVQAAKTEKGKKDVTAEPVRVFNFAAAKDRANRIFTRNENRPLERALKTGYLYVEQMKARDGKTEGWGLFPFNGERGLIGENDKKAMAE